MTDAGPDPVPRRKAVTFNCVVDVYAARPSQIFFRRDMSYARDFQFAEPGQSALKVTTCPPTRSEPDQPAVPRVDHISTLPEIWAVASRLLIFALVGHFAIGYLSRLVVPVCEVSYAFGFRPLRVAAPPDQTAQELGHKVCTSTFLLIALTLVAWAKSV
jgi:hypothetical protein